MKESLTFEEPVDQSYAGGNIVQSEVEVESEWTVTVLRVELIENY